MKTNVAIVITFVGAIATAIIVCLLAPKTLGIPPFIIGTGSGLVFYFLSKMVREKTEM